MAKTEKEDKTLEEEESLPSKEEFVIETVLEIIKILIVHFERQILRTKEQLHAQRIQFFKHYSLMMLMMLFGGCIIGTILGAVFL